MKKDERDAMDIVLARAVLHAHRSYIAAINAAGKFGLVCRDPEEIYRVSGRGHIEWIKDYDSKNITPPQNTRMR